jgi:hypothetical protein
MKFVFALLLILGAHFNLTPFAPAEAGKAWVGWPFAADSKPWLSIIGGLPQQSGSMVTTILAGAAGLAFIMALMSLFGWLVPAEWLRVCVVIAAGASMLLYVLYFGIWSLIPIAINVLLLWSAFTRQGLMAGVR